MIILGILQSRPMHGYEIQQLIQEEQMERWANILSGSIYFALNQMEKEGLIAPVAEERTGNRLRKKYAITAAGRVSLLELLRKALASPPHSLKSDFSLALGFAMLLSREERDELLMYLVWFIITPTFI
ncbi:MAG TPA: PadR family transcriptional regulator [Bacillota bacterium]|nr:PadR family transcriptional regulator [Bacillota bacterium]